MKTEQSTIHIVSANLGRWIGPRLPEAGVESAREHLRANDTPRCVRGSWVMVFGDDLHLHLTTFNGDFPGGEGAKAYAYALFALPLPAGHRSPAAKGPRRMPMLWRRERSWRP